MREISRKLKQPAVRLPRRVLSLVNRSMVGSTAGESAVPDPPSDQEMTVQLMASLTARATYLMGEHGSPEDPPHPLVTSKNLSHHLGQASQANAALATGVPGAVQAVIGGQRHGRFESATIHCFHQLDHRTTATDLRILELEAQLMDASRRIQLLEAERRI